MSAVFSTLFHQYSAFIALILYLTGGLFMFRSISAEADNARRQRALTRQLHEQLVVCLQQQIVTTDQVTVLSEQCDSLKFSQNRLNQSVAPTERFAMATRLLKRGSVETALLEEIGLKTSEIRLLKRLHRTESLPKQSFTPTEWSSLVKSESTGCVDTTLTTPNSSGSTDLSSPENSHATPKQQLPSDEKPVNGHAETEEFELALSDDTLGQMGSARRPSQAQLLARFKENVAS
ncbi:MAG: hypothetical protein AAF465_04525 [Pseudomonadota bacterium]